jgi:hypothetical protein
MGLAAILDGTVDAGEDGKKPCLDSLHCAFETNGTGRNLPFEKDDIMNLYRNVFCLFLMSLAVTLFSCEGVDEVDDVEDNLNIRAGTVTYQAESFTFQSGCTRASNHIGYTGTGFMDYGGNGSLVEWDNVNVAAAGQYKLIFRYANGSSVARQCAIAVNGATLVGNAAFARTGAWTTWSTFSITAALKAGNNKVRVTANTSSGGPNLDKMDVEPVGGTPICVSVSEGTSATLSCPSGQVITSVQFASYGLPTGACPSFATGSCHASTSKTKVESLCLNKPSCTVSANNAVFGDPCFGTVKMLAVAYSCSSGDTDQCPTDPNKTSPGICGCGTPDTDSDGDGTANCKDNCPTDPNKTQPGLCGCGKAEGTCGDSCARPNVELVSPAQNASFGTNESVVFEARVKDDRDAAENLRVEWRSSLYGLIGTASPGSNGILRHTFKDAAVGTHTIELSVRDSDCGTTVISFNVSFTCPVGSQFCPVPVVLNGPPSKRANMIFLGDGFTASEQQKFATYVKSAVNYYFGNKNPPFNRYAKFVNVWRVDLVSNKSGADDSSEGIEIDTFLDGDVGCANWGQHCYWEGNDCDCMVSWKKTGEVVTAAIENGLPGAGSPGGRNWTIVALNTNRWSGGAHGAQWGNFFVYSTLPSSGDLTFHVMGHEGGHAFHGFSDWSTMDEYKNAVYPYDAAEDRDLTTDISGAKWSEWLGAPQPDNDGPVGTYEGCCYVYGKGVWRPSPQSRMFGIEYPLDRMQRQYVIQDLYTWSAPIDAVFPSSLKLRLGDTASVQLIDPVVQLVSWTLDGVKVAGGESLNTSTLKDLKAGTHTLTVTVRDQVLDYAYTNNYALDLVRRGGEALKKTVTFVLEVP